MDFYIEGFFLKHKYKIKKTKEQIFYSTDGVLSANIDKVAFEKMLETVKKESVKLSARKPSADYSKEIISESMRYLLYKNDRIKEERYYKSPNRLSLICIHKNILTMIWQRN